MKTHLNLHTRDLDKSVDFYRVLLHAEPVKRFEDYALFVTDDPGLELALDLDHRAPAASHDHFGIAVATPEEVVAAVDRLRAADVAVVVEGENVCCYAKQTKVWATDPEGRRWETYAVLEETQVRSNPDEACCVAKE